MVSLVHGEYGHIQGALEVLHDGIPAFVVLSSVIIVADGIFREAISQFIPQLAVNRTEVSAFELLDGLDVLQDLNLAPQAPNLRLQFL